MNFSNLSHNQVNESKIYNYVQFQSNTLANQYKASKQEVARIATQPEFCANSIVIAANYAERIGIQSAIWHALYITSLDCNDAEVSQFELVRSLQARLALYIAEHHEYQKHIDIAAAILNQHFS